MKDAVRRERASKCPQATDEPPGSCKAPRFALWATHSSVSWRRGTWRRKSWEGLASTEKGLLRGAVNQRLERRDPFPPPSEQPCTEGSYSWFFTSRALAVRGAVFLFHSNRNHPYTSISVNCCTQNAKRLLGCFAVKTTGPPIFCFNNKKFNLQDAKDQTVCSKLTIFHIPLPPPTVLVSKS